MTIKINAAFRLRATAVKADWFDDLGDIDKKAYTKLHPNSKHAEGYSEPNKHDVSEESDKRRTKNWESNRDSDKKADIANAKRNINELIDDIKDIEGDGDDASAERKLLKEHRADLAALLHPD